MTMTSIMATAGVDFDEGLSGKVTEQQPTNFCGTKGDKCLLPEPKKHYRTLNASEGRTNQPQHERCKIHLTLKHFLVEC